MKLFVTNICSVTAVTVCVCIYIDIHTHMWNLVLFNVKADHQKVHWHKTNGRGCIHSGACFTSLERNRIHVVSLYSVKCLDILYITINICDAF